MNITRQADGVLYNCHRAACGVRGFTGTGAWTMCATGVPERELRPYEGEQLELEPEDAAFFFDHYELDTPGEIMYRTEHDEYLLPISWLGYERGVNVRQPWDGAPRTGRQYQPKSKVYMHSYKPVQATYSILPYGMTQYTRVILVEDQLSAYKASLADGVELVVALMGAHLDIPRVREIAELRAREVVIALDADATSTAFKMGRDYGLAFPKVRVAILEKDLKDTKLADIPRVLGL